MCACVCMCWFMGVPASHADDDGHFLKICACRTQIPTIRKGYMCSSLAALHATLIQRSGYGYGPVSLIILAMGTAHHHVTHI